ncbi:hypothetical protein CsSME_00041626 [Camellia sinensis var. sinensis]
MTIILDLYLSNALCDRLKDKRSLKFGGLGAVHQSTQSLFSGQPLKLHHSCWASRKRNYRIPTLGIMMVKPTIQFIQRTDKQTIPDVRQFGDITGFYMIDEDGVLQSVDVSAKFVNVSEMTEAKYITRSPIAWDRLMRFMKRYAN